MKNKSSIITSPAHLAGITALVFGLLTHLFGLVNIIHNTDNISVQPAGYGTGITSGRWLLTILGDFFKKAFGAYNLSWFNGLIFLLLLAVSAGFLVSLLGIKSRKSAILIGAVFVSFPTVTATLFYAYTTPYYGIAILCAILAVYVFEKCRYPLLPSALFTALALGIYQGYLPLTVGIFVLLLLKKTLEGKTKVSQLFLTGIRYCFSIILGLLFYFGLLQLSLAYYEVSLGTYQGIDQMGNLSLSQLPALILHAFSSCLSLPVSDYCDLAQTQLLKLAYALSFTVSILMILYILLAQVRNMKLTLFTLFLCIVFPIAVNLIVIMCPSGRIHTLMVYSFVLVLIAPLVVWEMIDTSKKHSKTLRSIASKLIITFLIVAIFSNAYLANVNYTAIYYGNRQTENYISSLVTQIRMTEGFDTEKEWAFLGTIDDPLLKNAWQKATVYTGSSLSHQSLTQYSWKTWIRSYIGYSIPLASDETVAYLQSAEEVISMPCWPAEGSIKVIDNVVVIKFQDQ